MSRASTSSGSSIGAGRAARCGTAGAIGSVGTDGAGADGSGELMTEGGDSSSGRAAAGAGTVNEGCDAHNTTRIAAVPTTLSKGHRHFASVEGAAGSAEIAAAKRASVVELIGG